MNAELVAKLGLITDLTLRAESCPPWRLPLFFIRHFVGGFIDIKRLKIEHIHVGDGVLAPLGYVLSRLAGIPVSATIHGLDVTYGNPIFKLLVLPFVRRIDSCMCVSEATKKECLARGFMAERLQVIGLGIVPGERNPDQSTPPLSAELKSFVAGKRVLLSVGRLVPRKGVYWLIEEVMPKLSDNDVLLVAGSGEDSERIERLIQRLKLNDRVKMLGQVTNDELRRLYECADVFLMPNIPQPGNVEGFGIVVLEAASTGLPVAASRLGGIIDALKPGTGYLFEPQNVRSAQDAINKASGLRRKDVQKIAEQYTWDSVASAYLKVIENLPTTF